MTTRDAAVGFVQRLVAEHRTMCSLLADWYAEPITKARNANRVAKDMALAAIRSHMSLIEILIALYGVEPSETE